MLKLFWCRVLSSNRIATHVGGTHPYRDLWCWPRFVYYGILLFTWIGQCSREPAESSLVTHIKPHRKPTSQSSYQWIVQSIQLAYNGNKLLVSKISGYYIYIYIYIYRWMMLIDACYATWNTNLVRYLVAFYRRDYVSPSPPFSIFYHKKITVLRLQFLSKLCTWLVIFMVKYRPF